MREILKTELMAIASQSELAFVMKSFFYPWLRICKHFFEAGVVEGIDLKNRYSNLGFFFFLRKMLSQELVFSRI